MTRQSPPQDTKKKKRVTADDVVRAKKKGGKNLWKMLAWRPPGPLLERLERWRAAQAAENGRERWPMSAALEEIATLGLDVAERGDRIAESDTDAIESRLDTLKAQTDEVAHGLETVSLLLDALGPACVAAPRVLAAWMAADPEQQLAGETAELAEDRILDDLEIVCQNTWSVFRDEARPEPEPAPSVPGDRAWPDARAVLQRYLKDERKDAAERVAWRAAEGLRRRLDSWARKEDISRTRAISVLVELALDIADGQQTLPKHRALVLEDAVFDLQLAVRHLSTNVDALRRRLDVLGAKVCGMPEVLVHWQARDPDLVAADALEDADIEEDESPEAREERLLVRYWTEGRRVWQAVVDSLQEPTASDDGEDLDDLEREDEELV